MWTTLAVGIEQSATAHIHVCFVSHRVCINGKKREKCGEKLMRINTSLKENNYKNN